MHILRPCLFAVLLAILSLVTATAGGRTFETLFSDNSGRHSYGTLAVGNDGNFYGTTLYGGANDFGTVFKVTPSGVLTTLYSFNNANGRYPSGPLVLGNDGNFYGTTRERGEHGHGTIFEVTSEGVLTTLHSFNKVDGSSPNGLRLGNDGAFYGTASSGGANNLGTIFKFIPGAGMTILHSFNGATGSNPRARPVQGSDGNLYGTSTSGGASDNGTVYKITPQGVLTTLHSFTTNSRYSYAGLIEGDDGSFYGTTIYGGASDRGTVFKVTPGGEFTTISSFNDANGANPQSELLKGNDGNFYGTAAYGANNGNGTLFKVTPTGVLTALHAFRTTDGSHPYAGLVVDSDGSFLGVTADGGASGFGTAFKFTPEAKLITLCSIGTSTSRNPGASLVMGNDGNFYGTTTQGGTNNHGTIFEVTPGGALTTLYSLRYADGAAPHAPLILGRDGSFYGTASDGGASDSGTVFKVTPEGEFTRLHSFNSTNGSRPYGGLVEGGEGNFYGTTFRGGSNGAGTIFKITPAGALVTLHSFNTTDGSGPDGTLVLGRDGNLYGMTTGGGASHGGTIFKVTPEGVLTTLFSFTSSSGRMPEGGLVLGGDGNFYGTTRGVFGTEDRGTVFKVTPAGEFTTVYRFDSTNGFYSRVSLAVADNGNLYGTTALGGAKGYGTLFEITPEGVLTRLHSFDGNEVGSPSGRPIFGSDGRLYGLSGQMTVWRFSLISAPVVANNVASDITATGAVLGGSVLANGADATVSFEYGLTTSYGNVVNATPSSVSGHVETPVSVTLSGLQPHTRYYFRLKAANSEGTAVSDEGSFTTANVPPAAGYTTARITAGETVTVTLPFTLTDNDGDTTEVQSISASPGAPFTLGLVSEDTVTVTGSVGAVGTGRISFTVSDGYGGMASGAVLVAVTEAPGVPLAELLVAKGQSVADTGAAPGIPAGAVWHSFGVPCATQSGDMAFAAVMRAGKAKYKSIVLQRAVGASTQVIARDGDPVPEIEGARFVSFKDPLAVTTYDGETVVAFQATFSGGGAKGGANSIVCRYSERKGLELLGRTGAASAVLGEQGVKAASFTSLGMGTDGALWATVTLLSKVGGVGKANNQALLAWTPDSKVPRVALQKGERIDTAAGEKRVATIGTLAAAGGSPGHGRWTAPGTLSLRLSFTDKTSGIYTANNASETLEEVASKGSSVRLEDETELGEWVSFGLPALDSAGGMTFKAKLKPGAGAAISTAGTGIFRRDDEGWALVASTGVESFSNGVTFTSFKDPVSNAQGVVTFVANEKQVGKKGSRVAVWTSAGLSGNVGEAGEASRTLTRIAASKDIAEGAGGATFASFVSLALPDGENAAPVFVSTLSGRGITKVNNRGLWTVMSGGKPYLVLRNGFPVRGLTERGKLKSFSVLEAVSGSPAQSRAFDGHRGVKVRAVFQDNSQALLNVILP